MLKRYGAEFTILGELRLVAAERDMGHGVAEALRRLSCEDEAATDDLKGICAWGLLAGGQPVEKGEPLFPRLG